MDKYIFGITGGTGSGKSTVSGMFRQFGVYVSDADLAARAVCKNNSPCLDELCGEFGTEILNRENNLNRCALAAIVFDDKKKLAILNRITHKYIKEYISEELSRQSGAIAAIDGAVLIGSPVMELCESIVVVTAKRSVRRERIMLRDGLSEAAADARINSQMSDEEYVSNADYIIENDGDESRLEVQIERIFNQITNAAKKAAKKKKAEKTTDQVRYGCTGYSDYDCYCGDRD